MNYIKLTDWDCFLIQKAFINYFSENHSQKMAFDNYEYYWLRKNKPYLRPVLKVYALAKHYKKYIKINNHVKHAVLSYLESLQSSCRHFNIGLDCGYNPHFYTAILKKFA